MSSGTTTQEGTGIYELAVLAWEAEMASDDAERERLHVERNAKINDVLDKGASVEAIVAATNLYRSTIILVRHPERWQDYETTLGRAA